MSRQGADDVVGLEAGSLEHRNAIGLQRAPDVGHLLRQVVGHRGAIGLVAVVGHVDVGLRLAVELAQAGHRGGLLVAKGGSGHVEDGGQVLRLEVGAQLAQHVDEDERRAGRDAGLGRHRPLPRHGVIGAEDERHRVDQVDAALGTGGLSRNNDGGLGSRAFAALTGLAALETVADFAVFRVEGKGKF